MRLSRTAQIAPSRTLACVLWAYVAAGLTGAIALMVWYWPGSFFDSTTSSVWLALAWDLAHGVFYRPVVSGAGYGGTRYMPLLFVAYAGLLRAGVDPILAGIVLMQISVVALAAVLWRVLRLIRLPFVTAAPLALSVFCTAVFQSYCTDIRPDYFAAAASIGAVGFALAYDRGTRPGYLAAAGAACVGAGATKATSCLLFAPIALWLMATGRRRTALVFSVCVAAAFAAIVVLVNVASGGQFVANLRAMATAGMTASDMRAAATGLVARMMSDPFVLAPAFLGLVSFGAGGGRLTSLPHLHFIAVMAATLAIFASPGTVSNHLIEVHAAGVLLVGISLQQGNRSTRLVLPVYALLTVMAVATAIPLPGVPSVHRTLSRQGPRGGRPRAAIAGIHAEFLRPGVRYLSADPIVPLLNQEHPLVLDPFAAEVFLRTGHPAGEDLRDRITRREFAVVVIREERSLWRNSDGTGDVPPTSERVLAVTSSELIRALLSVYEIRAVRRPFLILGPLGQPPETVP